jgi:hypothetical protein
MGRHKSATGYFEGLSDSAFIRLLVGCFFAGAAIDLLLTSAIPDPLARAVALSAAIGPVLALLLAPRLERAGLSRRWSLLGLFPVIGFLAGLALFFYEPAKGDERS